MIQDFVISETATKKLEKLTAGIIAKPGKFVDPKDCQEIVDQLNFSELKKQILAIIEEKFNLTEVDFLGILRLAYLTEVPTWKYTNEFVRCAQAAFGANSWLENFTLKVWTPDEELHAAPFLLLLMIFGYSEEQLRREADEVEAINFVHVGGKTAVHVTTFGVLQEFLTDNWHGLIAMILKLASALAALLAIWVKRRETLHRVWYSKMTSIMVLDNPSQNIPIVAESSVLFELPGNSLIPHIQRWAEMWIKKVGGVDDIIENTIHYAFDMVGGNTTNLGHLGLEYIERKRLNVGRLSPDLIGKLKGPASLFSGWGDELVGQAVLSKVGLDYLYLTEKGRKDRSRLLSVPQKLLRPRVAKLLPANLGFA